MAVFYSFHYGNDNWRVQQIRNIGIVDNSAAVASQDWEAVRYKSNAAIRDWIDRQMAYKRTVVVLIGSETASRQWVQYEINRAWSLKKPLLGIRINGLKDRQGLVSPEGQNPFDCLSDWKRVNIPIFTPQGFDSKQRYADIRNNLSTWIQQGYKRP